MRVKNEFKITLDRHGYEEEETLLPIARKIVEDKLVGNIFADSVNNKVYKCIGIKYLSCWVRYFVIEYTFECVYTPVPAARFEEFSTIGVFDDVPYLDIEECRND
jgi:hypothetical protein